MTKSKWKPKPGQTDFTNIRWAPVINCVVKYKDRILVVRRNETLNFYPGYWNGISGFLDDNKSLREKVEEEMREELGLTKRVIKKITLGKIFHQDAPKYKKTWIVHPVLVEVSRDIIKLDWEAQAFKWLNPSLVRKLRLLPGFSGVLKALDL
jgi:isopentenyldiphosphate isomerase